jgi:hypothetical protein
LIVDRVISPVDAVKAYHAVLQKLGVRPQRSLDDDLKLTSTTMSYGGSSSSIVVPATPAAVAAPAKKKGDCGCGCDGKPGPASCQPQPKAEANGKPTAAEIPKLDNGAPDFARMDVAQRLAYHRKRLGLGA